jgi:hypothetical protein
MRVFSVPSRGNIPVRRSILESRTVAAGGIAPRSVLRCGARSWRGTGTAAGRPAAAPPGSSKSITSFRGRRADRTGRTTWSPYVRPVTGSHIHICSTGVRSLVDLRVKTEPRSGSPPSRVGTRPRNKPASRRARTKTRVESAPPGSIRGLGTSLRPIGLARKRGLGLRPPGRTRRLLAAGPHTLRLSPAPPATAPSAGLAAPRSAPHGPGERAPARGRRPSWRPPGVAPRPGRRGWR